MRSLHEIPKQVWNDKGENRDVCGDRGCNGYTSAPLAATETLDDRPPILRKMGISWYCTPISCGFKNLVKTSLLFFTILTFVFKKI
jgi:hypothetical protein